MMAETVTVHFIDENTLSSYDAYVFDASTDKTISEQDHPWPGKRTNYTTATVNGRKVVTWTIDLLNCTLDNARIVFNDGVANSNNKFPFTGGFKVENDGYYNNKGLTTPPSEGSGSGSEITYPTITVKSNYGQNWDVNKNSILPRQMVKFILVLWIMCLLVQKLFGSVLSKMAKSMDQEMDPHQTCF